MYSKLSCGDFPSEEANEGALRVSHKPQPDLESFMDQVLCCKI